MIGASEIKRRLGVRAPALGVALTLAVVLGMAPYAAHAQVTGGAQGSATGLAPPTGPVTDLTIEEIAEGVGPDGDRLRSRVAIMERMHARPTGPEATLWVQLLDVVDEVDPVVAPVAVRAVGLAIETDQSVRASEMVMEAAEGAEATDRAALLALAAHLAHRSDRRRAAEIRGILVAELPDARQAPEAQLLRAQWLLRSSDLRAEGLALLEELIVSHPTHPITPEARRLFAENEPQNDEPRPE